MSHFLQYFTNEFSIQIYRYDGICVASNCYGSARYATQQDLYLLDLFEFKHKALFLKRVSNNDCI